MVLGYPNSKNKKIDHVNRVVHSELWKYAGLAAPDQALQAKLGVSGKDHLFIKFNRKYSRAADGTRVNSISTRGISGGAVFDSGKLADPHNLQPDAYMPKRLAAIVIEYHPNYERIVAVKIRLIRQALGR